jgi:hypothetical protein
MQAQQKRRQRQTGQKHWFFRAPPRRRGANLLPGAEQRLCSAAA